MKIDRQLFDAWYYGKLNRLKEEYKTDGLHIHRTGNRRDHVRVNKRGQKILYEELKRRFNK